jgi:flavin-dependent dehydrogenase
VEVETRRLGMTYDLAIVGGGPAGCAAAIAGARSGASVLLLERGRFPRHKVCGEFVSAESLNLLRTLLAPDFQNLIARAPRIEGTRVFVDGSELAAEIYPPAASIARFDLDVALWNSCLQSRVDARSECEARTVDGAGPFRVTTADEVFEAKALVNSSGRWSRFTSPAIRADMAKEQWVGVKAHFCEASAPCSVDLYFFDGGYCGVQPVGPAENGSGRRINACAMVRADVATTLAEVLRCHPALFERSRTWESLMEPVTTSPLVFHDPEPVQGSMLQVGDAASFVDPFVGDGISLALRSGALAAECLTPFFRGESVLEQTAARYRSMYGERLAHVFRTSSTLRGMLGWPKFIRKPVLSVLAKTPFVTKQIVKMTR